MDNHLVFFLALAVPLQRLQMHCLTQIGNSLAWQIDLILNGVVVPLSFLFPLIEKERLCETLVEKICSRFRVTQ